MFLLDAAGARARALRRAGNSKQATAAVSSSPFTFLLKMQPVPTQTFEMEGDRVGVPSHLPFCCWDPGCFSRLALSETITFCSCPMGGAVVMVFLQEAGNRRYLFVGSCGAVCSSSTDKRQLVS